LAGRLAAEPIDLVVASDLRRARATAEHVLAPRADRPVITLAPAWREQAFGVLEGLDAPTILQRHPELWAAWKRHDADYALPDGGESVRAFHARVLAALQALAAEHAGRRVAVFTHGGVLDMLWRTAHGLPLAGERACDIPNTGINRLRWDGGRLQILQWADAAHLLGLARQAATRMPDPR
jgi:probable phosphoglycerate mutase